MTEHSQWIWQSADRRTPQGTLLLRRDFHLASLPESAELNISANHIYRVYLNGILVGRGPDRADPRFPYFDSYQVSAQLKLGNNRILVLAHHYDWSASPAEREQGRRAWCLYNGEAAVRAELKIGDFLLGTDSSWQVREAEGWGNRDEAVYRFLAYRHEIDLPAWHACLSAAWDGKPDVAWTSACQVQGAVPGSPLPRETPYLQSAMRTARQISTLAPTDSIFPNLHAATEANPNHPLTVNPAKGGAWVSFDLGRPMGGFPVLDWESAGPGTLQVYLGEGGRNYLGDVISFDAGRWQYEALDWRGGRYLTLCFQGLVAPAKIHGARFREMVYPFEERGDFACSDGELTALWRLCRATAWSGVKDHLVDCVGREQALWIADVMVHGRALRAAFGDLAPVEKVLRQALRVIHEDGVVPVPGPVALGYKRTEVRLPWSEQPLTLANSILDHYLFTGSLELARYALPRLEKLYHLLEAYQDEEGLLQTQVPGRPRLMPFGGWTPMLKAGTPCALNGEYALSLSSAARLAEALQEKALGEQFYLQAERVRQALGKRFWDEERSLFRDGDLDGLPVHAYSLTANSWAALCGAVPAGRSGAFAEAMRKDAALLSQRTPFDASLQLEALIRLDCPLHVAWLLKEYFGSIVRGGEPTLPEFWRANDGSQDRRGENSSACHPYGTGPTYLCQEYILGVTPLLPGYREVQIQPHPLGLHSARGRVPTVHGSIGIEWERTDTTWHLQIDLPEQVTATLRLPRWGWGTEHLEENGIVVWSSKPWEEQQLQAERKYESGAVRDITRVLQGGMRHSLRHNAW